MRRFFSPKPLAGKQEITLEGQLVNYITRVLRLETGAEFELFDGTYSFHAQLVAATKSSLQIKLLAELSPLAASPLSTHLGQALAKGDKFELVVQKATELGVNEITPLITQLTDVKLAAARAEKKLHQWHQIAISACEQSGRSNLVTINPPLALTAWLGQRQEDLRLLLNPYANNSALQALQPKSLALLIGPEAGLTEQENQLAINSGFTGLQLGPRILRTETAPLAALTLAQHLWGDFN